MANFSPFTKPKLNQYAFVVSTPQCMESCHKDSKVKSTFVPRRDPAQGNLCSFQVAWRINPHMEVGSAVIEEAIREHALFQESLRSSGATVLNVPFVHGAYDSIFAKDNAVLSSSNRGAFALLAKPLYPERQNEQELRAASLQSIGFEVIGRTQETFEGGDLVVLPDRRGAFLGFGFRSTWRVIDELSEFLGVPVTPLQLKDPFFYHLDTALAVLNDGTAFAYQDAFTEESWRRLQSTESLRTVIPVSRKEAIQFGLNWVEVGNTVILGSYVPEVIAALKFIGKQVEVVPLGQFQKAGGSAACLVAQVHLKESLNQVKEVAGVA